MIRKKLYLPQDGVNYIGLLIGPRGMFQKKLEGESGCKILIRGKGSQKEGQPPQPDDDDDQHVLIMGDTQEAVELAIESCNRIINADEETRNHIRKEQLKVAAEINNAIYSSNDNKTPVDESMLTPYGPPSPYAYILPVPNESIGLIIGKKGETIRRLQVDSGAKIQVAKKEVEETKQRYVFIEGPEDKYQHAKALIEEIVDDWRRNHQPQAIPLETKPSEGPSQVVPLPENLIGLLLGNNNRNEQDIISCIHERYSVKVYIPSASDHSGNRNVEVSGEPDKIVRAIEDLFNYIREKSPGTNLMMNPLFYASAMGWSKSADFAYPEEMSRSGGPPPGYPPMNPGYPPQHMAGPYPGYPMQGPHGYPPNIPYNPHSSHNPHSPHNPYDSRQDFPPNSNNPDPNNSGNGQSAQPPSTAPIPAPIPQPTPSAEPQQTITPSSVEESKEPVSEQKSVNQANPPVNPNSSDHERAHLYADHYSKTLNGPYQYYYDYYMKTYSSSSNTS